MKKYEVQHLITVCENFPVTMSAIVVKNEKDKKEILDIIKDHKCELIDNEIIFENGNVISIIEPKGENIRGKMADTKVFVDDFSNYKLEYEDLKDVYLVEDDKVIKKKKMCKVIEIKNT